LSLFSAHLRLGCERTQPLAFRRNERRKIRDSVASAIPGFSFFDGTARSRRPSAEIKIADAI
jgi:hypothetical protein